MNRYICIHGHFYQPPRENAWLETVELQESAAPYHNWNERINFECYAPNAASRILDDHNAIRAIVNNYRKISFNFGPTLLSWLEMYDVETYRAILEADRMSVAERRGHGNALAQVHSHLILPLCNARDRETQVIWGISDFERRFGRKPEGMWLSETAVNSDTLETLVDQGILFTVLAPRQAKAFRKIAEGNWRETSAVPINTKMPYRCPLPSGRSIALFFYDGNIAQDVAFNGLLNSGKAFAERFLSSFSTGDSAQLAHIATDGESYGHHHRHGEMALSYAINYIEEKKLATLTNYGEYLALCPPTHEVQIHENSSWSCVHGVERWRSNCGCNTGGRAGWSQAWRAPLRAALDWLRDELAGPYENAAGKLFKDPWAARNDYIEVILNRDATQIERFFQKHAQRKFGHTEEVQALRLLEMQRNALYMYTSCGWFFDEISGIETSQILQYACRAIDYAAQTLEMDLDAPFQERLSKAASNLPEYAHGAGAYRKNVLPARVDLERVGMHYAVSSIFEKDPERLPLFKYTVQSQFFDRLRAGSQVLSIGRSLVTSKITRSEKQFSFAALYLGQHNLIGNISTDMGAEEFNRMYMDLKDSFRSGNLAEVIGTMQQYFGSHKYSLRTLFKDEMRKVLNQVLQENFLEGARYMREIYTDNYQLMNELVLAGVPVPPAYKTAVSYVLNEDLLQLVNGEKLDLREFQRLIYEFRKWKVAPADIPLLRMNASKRILREMERLGRGEASLEDIERLNAILAIATELKFDFDRWKIQNLYFEIALRQDLPQFEDLAWAQGFVLLGEYLGVRLG
jgi:alpha-amylase/alpha-mannosidase (GH57 family)